MWSLFETKNQAALNEILHNSLKIDLLPIVESCIDQGADLASTREGLTPIERAAVAHEWAVVERIASKIKGLPPKNYQFTPVLVEAITLDEESAAIALISANTDLTQEVEAQPPRSILHLAIDRRNPRIVEFLIKKKPDLLSVNYPYVHPALGHAADMANISIRKKKTEMEVQAYWDLTLLIIPYAKAALEKEVMPNPWNSFYGFEAAFNYAAKNGNSQVMLSLIHTGLPLLDVSKFNLESKTFLHVAAEYNQFHTAALSIYFKPDLINRNRLKGLQWQNPADIDAEIVKSGKAWAENFHTLIEKCTLMLAMFSVQGSFSSCPSDLYPTIFMNLILLIVKDKNKDLQFNLDGETEFESGFNLDLTENKIAVSVAKIQWRHKVLRMINDVSLKPCKERDMFINNLRRLDDDKAIKTCINEFAHANDSEKKDQNRNLLRKHGLFSEKETSAKPQATISSSNNSMQF